MDTFCVSASTLSKVSALSHETLPATRICHNISWPHPLRGLRRVSDAGGPFPAPFPCSELRKTPLMVSALLHGYAVKSVLQGLVHADVGNVRFWHKVGWLTELKVRYEREADIMAR